MANVTSKDLITAKVFGDIPSLLPGQIMIAPSNNRLLDDSITPIDNFLTYPEWFKKLNASKETLKRCQGTQDFLNTGITWRLPADVKIRLSPNKLTWESMYLVGEPFPAMAVESFGYDQTGPIPATHNRKVQTGNWIKVVNPWEIKTAPGWSTMLLPNLWEPAAEWSLVPGVVHTDFYHHMNWVLNILTDKEEFVIPKGTPIAHAITFPRNVRQELLLTDDSVHNMLYHRGMGSVIDRPPEARKKVYRTAQRKANKECPVYHDPKPAKIGLGLKFYRLFKRLTAGKI